MDFGFIYFRDRNADRAAMGLGCLMVPLIILLPSISVYIFPVLYLTLLICAFITKFKIDNIGTMLLMPLASFGAALPICALFWWIIPWIMNTLYDMRSMLPFFEDRPLFAPDALSDSEAIFYFIIYFGCTFGTLFAVFAICTITEDVLSIFSKLSEKEDVKYRKELSNFNFYGIVSGIKKQYETGGVSIGLGNKMIEDAARRQCERLGLPPDRWKKLYEENKL